MNYKTIKLLPEKSSDNVLEIPKDEIVPMQISHFAVRNSDELQDIGIFIANHDDMRHYNYFLVLDSGGYLVLIKTKKKGEG